jgi:serine/threonine-protein kinase
MGLIDNVKRFLQRSHLDVTDRFDVVREGISGTMSKFYQVRERSTGKTFGLKILDPEKTEAFEARFRGLAKPGEGEISLLFDHPLIVKTFERGETTKGDQYILMEHIDGPGLNALIRTRDKILDGNRMSLFRQMAEALDVVHSAGFIHRDVCPRNFICSKDATSLKLIDFGLTVPAQREYMMPGNRTGTPHYMAPEILRRRPTDQRLDIFSLGVTAYQLFALELPWPGQDSSGKAAVMHDTRIPVDILTVCPQLNRNLAKLIHQCLETDPSGRPATVDQLLRLLGKVSSEYA